MGKEKIGDEERTGYGKPPKASRYQPGQSGNPKGRPKGSRGLRTDLDAIMAETIRLSKTGESLTVQQVILKALAQKAAMGNVPAAGLLLQYVITAYGFEDRREKRKTLSPQDDAILQSLLAWGSMDDPCPSDDGKEESHGDAPTDA